MEWIVMSNQMSLAHCDTLQTYFDISIPISTFLLRFGQPNLHVDVVKQDIYLAKSEHQIIKT